MQNLNWLLLTVHHPVHLADAVSNLLFEIGAQGIWEDEPDNLGRLVSKAGFEVDEKDFLENNLEENFNRLAEIFEIENSEFKYILSIEENHDWAEKWKEGLEPLIVNNKLLIIPTWWTEEIKDKPQNPLILNLDPGLAFGSGHHETTFLCLWALIELFKTHKFESILDVGAGSGILSLAAALLSEKTSHIMGLDNDSSTISVAEENAENNGLKARVSFSAKNLKEINEKFNLILANITKNPLLELCNDISSLAQKDSFLILSGLVDEQVLDVIKAYNKNNYGLVQYLGRGEWSALIMQKNKANMAVNRQII